MTLSIACPPIRNSAGIRSGFPRVSLYNLRRQRGERTSFDVCSESAADIARLFGNVRFTPESGHSADMLACPFCARS